MFTATSAFIGLVPGSLILKKIGMAFRFAVKHKVLRDVGITSAEKLSEVLDVLRSFDGTSAREAHKTLIEVTDSLKSLSIRSSDEIVELLGSLKSSGVTRDGIKGVLESATKIGAKTTEVIREYAAVLSKYKIDPPKWPDGISFNSNLKKHMSQLDGFTQQAGVKGAHNMKNFDNVVSDKGIRIVSRRPTGVEGIYQVEYQIPKLDSELKPVPGEFKAQVFPKTVYDPDVMPDSEMLLLSQIAAGSSAEYVSTGTKAFNSTVGGVDFRVYLRDGVVTNVHPR